MAAADQPPPTLTLENQAIKISVNNTDDGRGRFAVDVTGGDPCRTDDDGQPLIYGRPVPWTSYATVLIDGKACAFGGPTARRAGRDLPTGKEIMPPTVKEGRILAAWRLGDLEITQSLSIVEGPTTGIPDTARIAYTLVNRGQAPCRAGLRICLDTMLGSNDGAPFRLGDRQIMTDLALARSELQPYWQAFDSLNAPRVIAQGSLSGGELTPPDHVIFTNWGNLADAPWEPVLAEGRDFTRAGEFELDSAVALFWDETAIPPGGALTRVIYYGLGSVTIAKGDLNLGLTAPAAVEAGEAFMVLAYVENSGNGQAREAELTMEAPASCALLTPARVRLGRLLGGEASQAAWMIRGTAPGTVTIRVTTRAEGIGPVNAERTIRLIAPAKLALELAEPPSILAGSGRYHPYPVPLQATVRNVGGSPSRGVWVRMAPGRGMALAPGESPDRCLGELAPGAQAVVTWHAIAAGEPGVAHYLVTAGSAAGSAVGRDAQLIWPDLAGQLKVLVAPVAGYSGWYRADLRLLNLPEAARVALDIRLGAHLRLLTVQRGGFEVVDGQVLALLKNVRSDGTMISLRAERPAALGRADDLFATLWLKGEPAIIWVSNAEITDSEGRTIPAAVIHDYEGSP